MKFSHPELPAENVKKFIKKYGRFTCEALFYSFIKQNH